MFCWRKRTAKCKEISVSTPYVSRFQVIGELGFGIMNQETCSESKVKLLELCKRMDSYLEKGDYFELYSCWIGEETDNREGEIILQINSFDIKQIEIPEKTLVRFEK